MLKKILIGFVVVVAFLVAGFRLFGPTVNGPMLDFLLGRQAEAPSASKVAERFNLPNGFKIGVFASNVPHARMMLMTETGDLLVAQHRSGIVTLLHKDKDGDGIADSRTAIASGLNYPHDMAIRDGMLYIAEETRIIRGRLDLIERTFFNTEVIFTGMPSGGNHRTRTIGFGPDGKLYVTVGSSCNVCIEEEPYRAEMLQMNPDGSEVRTYATGLRNSVGFDWQPGTGKLYATDNGRDLLGDDTPHDELNVIVDGGDYGWPYAYENRVADPDYGVGNEDKVAASIPMAYGLGAHRGTLGITFLNGPNTRADYKGAALVAKHGSWNRSELAGYKVTSLHFDSETIVEKDFLTGFELDEDVIGRPVGIVEGPDGAIYISDDYAGVVYRVVHGDLPVSLSVEFRKSRPYPFGDLSIPQIGAEANNGLALYYEHGCYVCHEPNQTNPDVQYKPLKELYARYDIPQLMALFKQPPGPMPSFELSEYDSRSIAIYLLWKDYLQ